MIDSRSISVTRRLEIKHTNRDHPIWIVKPTDFTCEPGPEIEPERVLQDPAFSLYCFDPENDTALFVESDDPAAVDRAPFYYQSQVEHAVGLVAMPLDVFHRVAEGIPSPPRGLIFVHSVGRCGSTLLSKALEAVSSVHSLSEPDDLTQMVEVRVAKDHSDAWLRKLVTSSVKWRCKPRNGSAADFVAIKMRSEVMILADVLGAAFPTSKHFFLYRDGVSWMQSVYRGWPMGADVHDEARNREMEESWARSIPLVHEYRQPDSAMNPVQIRILAWISCMEAYLGLAEMGIPLCAARFEDLTRDPRSILEQFFTFCDISDVDWGAIQEVLGRDSQAGTIFDREERRKRGQELPAESIQDVISMIASRPLLRTAEIILSGTLSPSAANA